MAACAAIHILFGPEQPNIRIMLRIGILIPWAIFVVLWGLKCVALTVERYRWREVYCNDPWQTTLLGAVLLYGLFSVAVYG